jgi:hypothetical protein
MQRFVISCLNCAWLALVFIGLPAVTQMRLADWQVSEGARAQWLMFWGLALALAGNVLAALGPVRGRKERKFCWEWAAVFGGLLLVQYAFNRGWFNFEWLKQALMWLQKHI